MLVNNQYKFIDDRYKRLLFHFFGTTLDECGIQTVPDPSFFPKQCQRGKKLSGHVRLGKVIRRNYRIYLVKRAATITLVSKIGVVAIQSGPPFDTGQ